MGNQGGKALKWLPAHFNYEKRNTPKSERERPSTLRDGRLVHHSAERRVAVKAGCKPVHFSLDGCPLSCYFSGSVATTSGHFVHKSERRTRDGAFIYAQSAVETRPVLTALRHASTALFSCRSKCPCPPGGNGIFTATPTERITHYTLLRKVVCQMGALPPLETPTRKGGTLPLHGAHTAFSCYPALRCIG